MSVVAIGAEEPLAEHMMVADFFREFTTIWFVFKYTDMLQTVWTDLVVSITACVPLHSSAQPLLIPNQHPHLSPEETWKSLFVPEPENMSSEEAASLQAVKDKHSLFIPSLKTAHIQMLEILAENEPDTVTIVAVGPLTNLALAAAHDPETFLRVKEVVVMGGAVDAPGNVSLKILFPSTVLFLSPLSPFHFVYHLRTHLKSPHS